MVFEVVVGGSVGGRIDVAPEASDGGGRVGSVDVDIGVAIGRHVVGGSLSRANWRRLALEAALPLLLLTTPKAVGVGRRRDNCGSRDMRYQGYKGHGRGGCSDEGSSNSHGVNDLSLVQYTEVDL